MAVKTIETCWIEMPDGARLAARMWLPEEAAAVPVPAILEYIPYRRRDRTRLRDESMHPYFAAAGYAAIRVDMRGSGDSDGILHDEYLEQELQDACDVIAWLARQPWCDGNVGMMGKSWGAYNSFQVAARRPPALKAIIPVMGTDDRWAECIHFSGGVLLNDNFWWGSIMQLYNAMPPDPEIVGERWRAMWRDRLDRMRLWPALWLEHQTRDEQWRHGSVCENYVDIQVPVYFFGGWADLFRDTPFRIAEHLKAPCKVLMGPWAHLYPHEGVPEPKVDFVAEAIRFFDHWLKGIDTGIMDEPRLRFFVQDSAAPTPFRQRREGFWVEMEEWPGREVAFREHWLNERTLGTSPTAGGDALTVATAQTYGAAGGDLCSFATAGDLPLDCRLDGRALSFSGPLLSEDMVILGQPRLKLHLAADRRQGFVAAVLCEEARDGAQTLVTRGFFNLVHRNGPHAVSPVMRGEPMEITLQLHGIAWRIRAGHRLVLHLSTTYWPICWPSPEPLTIRLESGRSVLELPVLAEPRASAATRELPVPPARERRPIATVRPGKLERTYSMDAVSGRTSHRVFIDGGVFGPVGTVRLDDIGTELSDISERIYEIGTDPLSARAMMKQSASFRRDDWFAEVDTFSEMTATSDRFILNAWVECRDNGSEFHRVDWHHEIARNGM